MYDKVKVEQIGPTTVRFTYPDCGHTSTKDYSKEKPARRLDSTGFRMLMRVWTNSGGATAACPTCMKAKGRAPDGRDKPPVRHKVV